MFADLHNSVFIPVAFIVIGAVALVVVFLQNWRLGHDDEQVVVVPDGAGLGPRGDVNIEGVGFGFIDEPFYFADQTLLRNARTDSMFAHPSNDPAKLADDVETYVREQA